MSREQSCVASGSSTSFPISIRLPGCGLVTIISAEMVSEARLLGMEIELHASEDACAPVVTITGRASDTERSHAQKRNRSR